MKNIILFVASSMFICATVQADPYLNLMRVVNGTVDSLAEAMHRGTHVVFPEYANRLCSDVSHGGKYKNAIICAWHCVIGAMGCQMVGNCRTEMDKLRTCNKVSGAA